jgi:hypothetical protein
MSWGNGGVMDFMKILVGVALFAGCAVASADVVLPGAKKACAEMVIEDHQEIENLMAMIQSNPQVEKVKEGDREILITTKQINLGAATTLRCTEITQGDVVLNYFRGRRPSCVIVQRQEKPSKSGKAPATAR